MIGKLDRTPWRWVALPWVVIAACAADSATTNSPAATVQGPSGTGGSPAPIAGSGNAGSAPPITAAGGTGGATMQAVHSGGSGGAPAVAGSGGITGAAGAPAPTGSGGMTGAAGGKPVVMVTPDQMLPPVTDYTLPGPFDPTMEVDNTGPDGMYTMYRPANVDANGFKFIPLTWGNGITTTPQTYPTLLNTVASHGFVIIASNDTAVTADEMTTGLDWLIAQNDVAGDLQGKLDTSRAVCLGYSLGGGASVACGSHPKVITTIAMHPAGGSPLGLHGPLLLFSGLMDDVCVPATFVQPVFDSSPVPTFFGMLNDATHFEPVLTGGRELAPTIAWLRLQVFGDQAAKAFFYGDDCTLCKDPWTMPQSKMLQ